MAEQPTVQVTILTEAELAEVKAEAIKAFVARVGERWARSGLNYPECIEQELAAMEKEV
jgi:hypothetical protein